MVVDFRLIPGLWVHTVRGGQPRAMLCPWLSATSSGEIWNRAALTP